MFKNDYFEVFQLTDDSVLIANREGKPYKWAEKAVECYCPAHNKEISPFLMVKYSDNTWSLCHAETGPMSEATRVPETQKGVCPIVFQEDFLEDEAEHAIKEGCFKKAIIGLVSLGAMLIGIDTIFQKCSPVKNEMKALEPQQEKSVDPKKDTKENASHTQDMCMVVKAEMGHWVKNVFHKIKNRG